MPGRTKANERITRAGRLTNECEALGSDRSTHVNPSAMGYTCNHTIAEAETGDPRTSSAVNLATWMSFRFGERL